ncbi:putative cyclic nucleotide-gated ion channel 19 [Arachis stenosperma]|uniref:putative cyclic nucleotide-gated ion channel 19 n=1 Tax=Arachis stenosperma TaxID=217475 RepID=UPI0025ACDC95|nr:putative cyclic nucleotide-gated ion channel 19 [Arachis stenosperma]
MARVTIHVEQSETEGGEEAPPPLRIEVGNKYLAASDSLGLCDKPFCNTCPSYLKTQKHDLTDNANNSTTFSFWTFSFWLSLVLNPHSKWDHKCVGVLWLVAQRTYIPIIFVTDLVLGTNIIWRFRMAYISSKPTDGGGYLVDDPTKIALRYILAPNGFAVDFFLMFPFSLVMIYGIPKSEVVPTFFGRLNSWLLIMLIVQQVIQIVKIFPKKLFDAHGTIWIVYAKNVAILVLIGHLVGCFGYLAAVQKVEKCLLATCNASGIIGCKSIIVCDSKANNDATQWLINKNASICFSNTSSNGIFADIIPLVGYHSFRKYIFTLFWGITQISNISGKTPSISNVEEVFFVWAIRALAISIFALIFGNITSIIQGLSRRKIDTILRLNEIERWSRHRHLPEDLSRRILDAEIQNWAATKGMKEEELLKSMPKDIQRDLTRHQFLPIIKKVQLFEIMHQSILDAICMESKWKLYLADSTIMYPGDLIEMIVFIVHGKLEIKDSSGTSVHISDGDACCQELLFWCLQRASSNSSTDGDKLFFPEERFLSTKSITCLTDVEAFVVEVTDLEKILTRFAKLLHTPRIEEAIKRHEMLERLHEESGSNQEEPQSATVPEELPYICLHH